VSSAAPKVAAVRVPLRVTDLDSLDRELVQLVLNEPSLVPAIRARVPAEALQEPVLRTILQTCYELDAEGEPPSFERVSLRLDDPALRSLAAGLLLPLDPAPLRAGTQPAPVEARLLGILQGLAERDWRQRLRDLEAAKAEVDRDLNPDDYKALQREYLRVLNQRPGHAKKSSAS
jgi:DNA primase